MSRALWWVAGALGVLVAGLAVLIVVVTVSESGPPDYEVTDDGGATDWSTIMVPETYGHGEYVVILDDAQEDRWEEAGGYYVRIECGGETVAEGRGAVGAQAAAQTGVDDGEWIVETTGASCD